MSILNSILLGILQGLTEFLPVSSSGHLVLAESLLGIRIRGDIAFEVFLHLGTLFSIVTLYRKELLLMTESVAHTIGSPFTFAEHYRKDEHLRLAWYIVLATIPAVVAGLLFEHQIEATFSDPKLVADMLLITGIILFLTRFARPRVEGNPRAARSFLIGIGQAVAMLPGISRSGSTISAALYLGVGREEAARFSFLLAVPVIAGAALLKSKELYASHTTLTDILPLLTGGVTAYVVGLAAIKLLLGVVRKGKLSWFAAYCIAVGITALVLL
ncbi:MAG: undecaprenyl-diphosphate phosphatase [Ignavibacteriales bacterium CG07_land_8_20_14_0_80_59_12]|nr:MAG: undecaprenyl-diphosphate phosphatase [Ignavibacteriales bacterium CG07_land_8_20_14_0_80_59_12]